MTQIIDYPMSTNFSGVNSLQANGAIDAGDNLSSGISGRLEIQNGVMVSTLNQTDTNTASGKRSEITASADAVGERWYTWEFMIPSSWTYTKIMTIMQIHDTPDGGDGAKFPNFMLVAEGNMLVALVPNGTLPTEVATGARIGRVDLIKDHWYSACLRVNWQTTTAGFREFFLDQKPLFREYSTPTHYTDTTGPYLKLGVYDGFSNGDFGTLSASYRNVKIWSGNDGYQAVMGGTPIPPTRQVSLF